MTPPFFFILGCGRSGTTLLVTLLDSHPEVAIPGESGGFILTVPGEYEATHAGQAFDVAAFLAIIESHPRFVAWGLDRDSVARSLDATHPQTVAGAIRVLYATYAAAQGKRFYGDKTPNYVLNIPRLAGLFPDARFVHVIRDGRDVALAIREMSWGPDSIAGVAPYWVERVSAGREAGRQLGAARYFEVRYEDLVADPESVVRAVANFLGIEYHPSMLANSAAVSRQIAMSPATSEDRTLLRPITPGYRDWRVQMDSGERKGFEAVAGALLHELGYPLPQGSSPPPVSPPVSRI